MKIFSGFGLSKIELADTMEDVQRPNVSSGMH